MAAAAPGPLKVYLQSLNLGSGRRGGGKSSGGRKRRCKPGVSRFSEPASRRVNLMNFNPTLRSTALVPTTSSLAVAYRARQIDDSDAHTSSSDEEPYVHGWPASDAATGIARSLRTSGRRAKRQRGEFAYLLSSDASGDESDAGHDGTSQQDGTAAGAPLLWVGGRDGGVAENVTSQPQQQVSSFMSFRFRNMKGCDWRATCLVVPSSADLKPAESKTKPVTFLNSRCPLQGARRGKASATAVAASPLLPPPAPATGSLAAQSAIRRLFQRSQSKEKAGAGEARPPATAGNAASNIHLKRLPALPPVLPSGAKAASCDHGGL